MVTFGFVFYKLFYAYHIKSLYLGFDFDTSFVNSVYLFLVIVLAFINWLLESSKWKLLVNKSELMSFKAAVVGVLSGVALGMITPNQIGNFIGRIIHLKQLGKLKGSLVSVIGHTAQVMMTLGFGLFALIWLSEKKNLITPGMAGLYYTLLLVLVVLSVVGYLNIHWVGRLTMKPGIKQYLDVFIGYSRSELMQVLTISFLRYAVFVIQYLLLVTFYHIEVGMEETIVCVCASLFIQAFVPSFILLDIGMRGASALWLFGLYTDQTAPVLLMTYTVWVINILLPGLVGLYFITKWRMDK